MRIGSLFSGAGGLDMAVAEVFGGEIVWHAEIDKAASKVLAYRFPGVPNLGSVSEINWATVDPVDVICGGFPCTDVSAAGKRAGMHGTRSGLWSHMAEAIDVLRPRYVVIENVRGLLNANANRPVESREDGLGDGSGRPVLRAIGAVLGDLADIGGYEARWVTLGAADVGAPHRRERVFILASAAAANDSARRSRQPRPGTSDNERQASRIVGHCSDVADTPRDGRHERRTKPAGQQRRPDAALGGAADVELLPTPSTHDKTGARSPESIARMYKPFANLNDTVVNDLLPTPNASDATGGDAHPDKREGHSRQLIDYALLDGTSQWGKYEPAIRRWEQIVGPAPAPTEPNKNGNPRLAAAFSEWLMGWPTGWVTDPAIGISRNDQLRIIGNGVVPQQAIAALRFLASVSVPA